MSDNLFSCQYPLASYEQAELLQQFTILAQATAGKLNPQALKLSKHKQELISNLRWKQFAGDMCLGRSWTVITTVRLLLPKRISGQVRVSNIYGETSGMPVIGATRLDANWSQANLMELLPPQAYRLLTSSTEPFSLSIQPEQVSLSLYRFYQSDFYLKVCSYLADLAERAMSISQPHQSPRVKQIELPLV